MSAASGTRAEEIAVAATLDQVIHELARALRRPIFHIHRGAVAVPQALALSFGWLAPAAAEPRLLRLTDAGLRALADARGLRRAGCRRANRRQCNE